MEAKAVLDFICGVGDFGEEGRGFMKKIVIVVTDLGNFKAYKLEKTNLNTPRLKLMHEALPVNGHGKIVEKVSDHAGRYHNGAHGKWATPWGEPHNINWRIASGACGT